MVTSGQTALRQLGFAVALTAATAATTTSPNPNLALIWLPSGIGIAGLVLLGWRAIWVVAGIALTYRLVANHPLQFAFVGVAATCAEALFGYWLVQVMQIRRSCNRLVDVIGIYVVALAAPLASIACVVLGRIGMASPLASTPFAGMGGWWRMNTIAILVCVPLALSWPKLGDSRDRLRAIGRAAMWGGLAGTLAIAVMLLAEASVSSVFLLGVLPLIGLAAALNLDSRGSSAVAFLSVVAIALPASCGIGVFEGIAPDERRIVTQIVLVGIAALSPMFGALLAERDANAERLLQSEGVNVALLRILPDASYRLTWDGTVLDAVLPDDPAMPRAKDLIGKHIRDITTPSLSSRLMQQLDLLHRDQPTEITDYQVTTPLGRRDREVRFVKLPNGEAMSVVRDITERKRAERQLALQANILEMIASGQRRNSVFTALVHGVETLIPDGRCSILLRHADRLHFACGPSLSDEYNQLVDGISIGVNCGSCGTAAATGEVVISADVQKDVRMTPYRDILKRFDLRACWSVPILSTDGPVLGTLAMYHDHVREPQPFEIDAVERAAVLAGLTIDSERRDALMASINKNVSEGLFRCIPGESFAYVNASFARMFGYDSPEDLLANWVQSENEPHRAALEQLVTETLSVRSRKIQLPRRDGSQFWALISTSVTFDDDDTELLCDGTVTDITSHKELEDQLRQAQKMEAVGQLAGGVAHDFNNLLTAISGFSETIESQLATDDPMTSDVRQIREACKRATGLTRQLLAFGRQQVLNPEVIELPAVVENIRDMMGRLIGGHIELVIAANTSSVRARVDRGQLEQVIINLVINARDAMPDGGRITIETETVALPEHKRHSNLPAGRYAVLRVRDTGTGMPIDVQARAFDPFFTTKAIGVGTGLGLSTVYGIVKQSGGDVVIDSAANAGTCMSVYLPFDNELPNPEPTVEVPRHEAKRGTILVVEDEPFVLDLAKRALTAAGHVVLGATDGVEALKLYSDHHKRIDMVVTDIIMPHMGGTELAAELHENHPGLRVLFMSGYAPETIDLPPQSAHTAFLNKPFSTAQLTDQVGLMLGQAAPTPAPNSPAPNSTAPNNPHANQ